MSMSGVGSSAPPAATATFSMTHSLPPTARTGSALPPATGPARRKVAICGKAQSSLHLAPFDDATWEIWGLGDLCLSIPRWSRWFELHCFDTGRQRWRAEYVEWLKQCPGPLYTHASYPDVPHGQPFPFPKLLARFGRYFTNSISWMIAFALDEGVDELALYGVDMAVSDPVRGNNGEYEHQRPSCEWMLGVAQGMGVRVIVPEESDLLKCHKVYAWETHKGDMFAKLKAREAELSKRLRDAEARAEQAAREQLTLQGALDDVRYIKRLHQ